MKPILWFSQFMLRTDPNVYKNDSENEQIKASSSSQFDFFVLSGVCLKKREQWTCDICTEIDLASKRHLSTQITDTESHHCL